MKRFGSTVAIATFALAAGCAHMQGNEGGWTTLVDASGYHGMAPVGTANWHVADGAVVADKGSGFLVTTKEYGDFEVRVEFWADADTNSGVFLRCADRQKPSAAVCYEVNIWDRRPAPEYGTGAIVDVAKVSPMPKAGGHWNTYEITARGDHLTVVLNGVKTADVHNAKHARGPLGLQYAPGVVKDSGAPIKFRNVKIRSL